MGFKLIVIIEKKTDRSRNEMRNLFILKTILSPKKIRNQLSQICKMSFHDFQSIIKKLNHIIEIEFSPEEAEMKLQAPNEKVRVLPN